MPETTSAGAVVFLECSGHLLGLAFMIGLTINGVPVYASGFAGHFVNARPCGLALHWRIGNFRVSTIGDYRPDDRQTAQEVGVGRYSETMVFVVRDDGTPEGEVVDWIGIGAWVAHNSADTRAAEALHYAVATAVSVCVLHGVSDTDKVVETVDARLPPTRGEIAAAIAQAVPAEMRNDLRVALDHAEATGNATPARAVSPTCSSSP